jgi:retron-type reverse transcriptase
LNANWIVDADVSGFFDNLDHGLLREIIKRRVNDGGLIRLIGKWLNAGVLEGKQLYHPVKGTPQGGVISPILANVFLHHVLDEWYAEVVKPRLRGRSFLIRFADDCVPRRRGGYVMT